MAGATNKTSYAPGEQVSVTITGGYQSGWIRAILYDQTMTELARSTGTATGGMGGGPGYPIALTAPAPTTPGTYTWNVAWYGNRYDLTDSQGGTTFFGPRWTPDPNNANHGREIVSTNSFTVAASAAPAIQLNPASLAFGTVNTGSTVTLTTAIQNTGTATLNVTAIALAAGTSSEYTFKPAVAPSIAAGGSITLSVTYTPVDAGADSGSLVITSNASTSPTSLQLTGTGSVSTPPPSIPQPAISLTPTSLDFGTVPVGGPSGELVTTIQNTGTASLEVTGIALCAETSGEFTWSPATPLTVVPGGSTTLTVHYTPVDAGTDAGCFAIASTDPATPSANLAVTGAGSIPSPPGPNPQPAIGLAPTSLDFGTVVTGGSISKTATITNLGTAPLDVTDIALCNATSTEFTWSPQAPLTLDPGAKQTLTVSYAPTQSTADTGCLTIASTDPTSPSVTLNLAANGVSPLPPGGLNIELDHFRATKKVKIGGRVKFKLEIENEEDSSGEAPATLVGIQNGVEVYNKTINLFVKPEMEEATWSFPSYTPTAKGKITWTLTIVDQSSGTNKATATTKVK